MSRISSLSPAALKAMFSPESDDDLITLLTLSGSGMSTQRVANGYTQRLSETADEVHYGVLSRGRQFTFIPFDISLPTEEVTAAPRCQITIHDVTYLLIPALRTITQAPSVTIELVLASSPDLVEVSFPGFLLGAIQYNAETITGELTVANLAQEPFPAHTFNPSYFPGLF